ncbi:MAG: hypothetical protein JKP90_03575 [Desulfofustis sp. PB-SRB1]|jgi:hypothetical protein|nr:hypothetical protein [Desulfofustis sp. PB-SRB1]
MVKMHPDSFVCPGKGRGNNNYRKNIGNTNLQKQIRQGGTAIFKALQGTKSGGRFDLSGVQLLRLMNS